MELTSLEAAVLDYVLAGDDRHLAVLREQRRRLRVTERDYSPVGFFTSFAVPLDAPPVELRNMRFGDVFATIEGLPHGAGFIVFVDEGYITGLEGYGYGNEGWPDHLAIETFSLRYDAEPREIPALFR